MGKQNLRSTRETELAETFPIHVVTRWIGNTVPVAAKHYLQLTDEHFDRAVGAVAVQNPVQQASAGGVKRPQPGSASEAESPDLQAVAVGCGSVRYPKASPHGFEP